MIAASGRYAAKLLAISADGRFRHAPRTDLARLFRPGDLVVANDAATLPASLRGRHAASGAPVELRLAGWVKSGVPTHFVAVLFGAGDHRTPTEDRPFPPRVEAGDMLALGPLLAIVERMLGHPRLLKVRFVGARDFVWEGIARHGRSIQYAHVPEPLQLWDVWTRIAARPLAFEAPSAGFALDWQTIGALRAGGIGFVTLTLAAGLSSTGDAALDRRLPFDEPFHILEETADAIRRTRTAGGRIIAVGTTVVRALEAAAIAGSQVCAGDGIAVGRIGPKTRIRIVDAILTGVHAPGESHYELLRAFAADSVLERMNAALTARGFRNHEFGDSVLIERSDREKKQSRTHCGASHRSLCAEEASMAL